MVGVDTLAISLSGIMDELSRVAMNMILASFSDTVLNINSY